MKKFISILIALFISLVAIGQTRTTTTTTTIKTTYNGMPVTIECVPRTASNYIGTFADKYSFNQCVSGRRMMIGGTTSTLLFSTALGITSLIDLNYGIDDDVARKAIYTTEYIGIGVSAIVALVGFYKWGRWEYNGRGIVYNF